MHGRRLPSLVLTAWALAAGVAAQARPLELASPFVDDMVLQRQMPVPVWGWATPGRAVVVAFAGQQKSARADRSGRWSVQLAPLTASAEERALSVRTDAGEAITRQGVLVGEVWLASGQSNMDWVAGKSLCRDLANRLQRSPADEPVREYNVDIGSSVFPRSRARSADGWKRSRHAGGFSALALAFAWELHAQLQVPIGILRATHGATAVETWTAYEGFAAHPELQHIAKAVRQADPTTADGQAAYRAFYEDLRAWQQASAKLLDRGGQPLPRPRLPGIAEDWKGATRMYNKKIAPLIPYAIRGAIWCQGTHNAGDGRIYAAKMAALVAGWRKNWGRPELPFYFTQMQCYGQPDPDNVGFADLREAQRLFFMNAQHVGMVLQHDLNPARPTGIHYTNKLDPGKRLARWALAHQYGKDIAYTGPIYHSHRIEGNTVRVRFEQRGPGAGLMVGSKGLEADQRKAADAYVEPARETKGERLRHFRLAGKDRVWHAADAVIDGQEVVVTSAAVAAPVGVQYAYSASPIGANLYNRAGLPATPFACFAGQQVFQAELPSRVAPAAAKAAPAARPYLQVASLFRTGMVLQRDRRLPVWGFARPGTEVTVKFAGQVQSATTGEFEQWRVDLEPLPAASQPRDLVVTCSDGPTHTVRGVVVGDVWVLTGSMALSGEVFRGAAPADLPGVREFRIRTKARRFREPRKRRMEVGGGKYVAFWRDATTVDGKFDTSVAAYHFAGPLRQDGVPLGVITLGADNPPLTWISYDSLQTAAGFEKERDELNLLYPNTAAGQRAVRDYIAALQAYAAELAAARAAGTELPDALAESLPAFPQPAYDQWARHVENATLTYNFCISPLTPLAVRGVVWVPGPHNIGADPARYAPALRAYADSLAATYGQDRVPFVYAQPAGSLAPGVTDPQIDGAVRVGFDAWPKSLRELATRLGAAAARLAR